MKRVALLILLAGVLSIAGKAAADPPIPVTCGDTITRPGQYRLAGDCGPAVPAGITIFASGVHLKLDGHTMTGPNCMVCKVSSGITASNVSDVDIQGPGTITNYPGAGVELRTVTNSRVVGVTCTSNAFGIAVFASDGNQIVNNVTDRNGLGIFLANGGSGNRIVGNEANANVGDAGIYISAGSTGSEVHGNGAFSNGSFDLIDENTTCDDNDWNGNHFATASPPSCIH